MTDSAKQVVWKLKDHAGIYSADPDGLAEKGEPLGQKSKYRWVNSKMVGFLDNALPLSEWQN